MGCIVIDDQLCTCIVSTQHPLQLVTVRLFLASAILLPTIYHTVLFPVTLPRAESEALVSIRRVEATAMLIRIRHHSPLKWLILYTPITRVRLVVRVLTVEYLTWYTRRKGIAIRHHVIIRDVAIALTCAWLRWYQPTQVNATSANRRCWPYRHLLTPPHRHSSNTSSMRFSSSTDNRGKFFHPLQPIRYRFAPAGDARRNRHKSTSIH
jgi:hypothetical protein